MSPARLPGISLGTLKFIRFALAGSSSAAIAFGMRVAMSMDALEVTAGGVAPRSFFSSSMRKAVVFFVVGEFVKSLAKPAVMFFGADPPHRYSFQNGTTRLSTATEMPPKSHHEFLLR